MKDPLTTEELNELGGYLSGFISFKDGNVEGCNNDFRLTEAWLKDFWPGVFVDDALDWLAGQGAACDCEVLLNSLPAALAEPAEE